MTVSEPAPGPGRPMARRAVRADPAELVQSGYLPGRTSGPAMIRPRGGVDLVSWIKAARPYLDAKLREHGSVLLRGFEVGSAARFEQVARAFTDDLLGYVEGTSPRTMLTSKVYTSTEYPPEFPISMHNELSYAHKWPGKLFFFCEIPAERGGETPVTDGRQLLRSLPAELVRRFVSKQVRYRRTMHDGRGPGLSWPTVFETTDRGVVEDYCAEGGIEYRWLPDGWLRTSQLRPAVIRHPVTAEEVWFNQADQWHPSNLGSDLGAAIAVVADETGLPLNAEYGDGTRFDAADLDTIRAAAREAAVSVGWARDDVLVVDNTLALHGRLPFEGQRRVLVSMGEPVRLDQVGQP